MGRRNRLGSMVNTIPSALGDSHVESAITTINKLCQCTMAALTEYTPSCEATIEMLFSPDDLAKAVNAKHLIEPNSWTVPYDNVAKDVVLRLTYSTADRRENPYPPIKAGALQLQPSATPLLKIIEQVRDIYLQFEEIKAVLNWFNRNATPGAIRYYFPAVLALCPNSPPIRDLQHVPTRYTQPKDINDWAQCIKDASACYASTQLLPGSAQPRALNTMRLTFPSVEIQRGNVKFATDQTSFNL